MQKIITPEQAKAIVAEIQAWHDNDEGRVAAIEQLYELTEECYLVLHTNGVRAVYQRDRWHGKIRPTSSVTLAAPDFTHPAQERRKPFHKERNTHEQRHQENT